MPVRVIITPEKVLKQGYNTQIWLGERGKFFEFDRLLAEGLEDEITLKFGKKSVKLNGYDYTQYNINGWSYYPVQMITAHKNMGIVWIKWKCEQDGFYFAFNALRECDFKYKPTVFGMCSDEENKRLSREYPQPYFGYDISDIKYLQIVPPGVNALKNFSFCYEFRRQMTDRFVKLTGDPKIKEKICISWVGTGKPITKDGFSYGIVGISPKPYRQMYADMWIEIKWRSNTDKEYIYDSDVINSDDVTFEFSDIVPEKVNDTKSLLADKDAVLKLAEEKPIASWLLD